MGLYSHPPPKQTVDVVPALVKAGINEAGWFSCSLKPLPLVVQTGHGLDVAQTPRYFPLVPHLGDNQARTGRG